MTTKAKVLAWNTFTSQKGRKCANVQLLEDDNTCYNILMFDDRVTSKPLSVGMVVTVKTGMDFRGSGQIQIVY